MGLAEAPAGCDSQESPFDLLYFCMDDMRSNTKAVQRMRMSERHKKERREGKVIRANVSKDHVMV